MAKRRTKNRAANANEDFGFLIKSESNAVVVRVPVRFYRRNGRQMILAKDDASGTNQQNTPAPNNTIAANLAKAWHWQEQLESGKNESLEELGRANSVDRTYVSRILRLTSLSPEIVERILGGDEPRELSLRKLLAGVPLYWKNQGCAILKTNDNPVKHSTATPPPT